MFTKPFLRLFRRANSRRRMAGCALLLAVLGCGMSACGSALAADKAAPVDKLAALDRQVIETTIRNQLDAFVRDDADRAFGFATPDIQRMFGSSEAFMQMVREHYEPVYRASSVQFERLAQVDGQWVQMVRLTDEEGKVWRARFIMRRQADRGWKVGGCQLVETSALST